MEDATRAASEANRLYWESDVPVAEIAAQLDLSRRALYDALQPMPIGASCAECGGELGYPNRSARLAGLAICATCGAEAPEAPRATRTPEPESAREPEPWTWSPVRSIAAGSLDRRVLWMGGAALAGALVAAAATLLVLPED